jgi:hypothetical protein
MNHLDIGFDGIPETGYALNVINRFFSVSKQSLFILRYFNVYFPRAINTSRYLEEQGGPQQFIYTTHSWLVYMYMNCNSSGIPQLEVIGTLKCPTEEQLNEFIIAIKKGWITWHAYPFNSEPGIIYLKQVNESIKHITEVADASLFEWGLEITHYLVNFPNIFSLQNFCRIHNLAFLRRPS